MSVRVPGGYNPANVAITGGSISGVTGQTNVLYQGGIPFISLSSGSVAAGGAITGITALPAVYPDAYCFFPANALATTIAAGWYYCTFSTTTAGVAFLNTYTSGSATIPASPTAVTDGKGAFTGDTGEEFGPTVAVPILNATSAVKVFAPYQVTNNANVKTGRIRMSGNAGTIFFSQALASVSLVAQTGYINNTGSVAKQQSVLETAVNIVPTSNVMGTVNTAVATTVVFSIQKATATDNIVLNPPVVQLLL